MVRCSVDKTELAGRRPEPQNPRFRSTPPPVGQTASSRRRYPPNLIMRVLKIPIEPFRNRRSESRISPLPSRPLPRGFSRVSPVAGERKGGNGARLSVRGGQQRPGSIRTPIRSCGNPRRSSRYASQTNRISGDGDLRVPRELLIQWHFLSVVSIFILRRSRTCGNQENWKRSEKIGTEEAKDAFEDPTSQEIVPCSQRDPAGAIELDSVPDAEL